MAAVGCDVATSTRVLLVSGSLRAGSTNTGVLRTAAALAPSDVGTDLYDGLGALQHFDPDADGPRPPDRVAALRDRLHRADAVLFCTPEYAGGLPGSFKNLLDWCIGDADVRSLYGKPVAWINASTREARWAHESLRLVLGFAHATVVEDACVHVPVGAADVGDDGLVVGEARRVAISGALERLARASG